MNQQPLHVLTASESSNHSLESSITTVIEESFVLQKKNRQHLKSNVTFADVFSQGKVT